MKGYRFNSGEAPQVIRGFLVRALLSIILVFGMMPSFALTVFADEDIIESDLELIEAEEAEDEGTEPEEAVVEDDGESDVDDEIIDEEGVEEAGFPEGFIGLEETVVDALETTREIAAAIPLSAAFIPIVPTNSSAPPLTLTGTFTLPDGWQTGSTPIEGFPGTLDVGYEVVHFGTVQSGGYNGLIQCIQSGAANWGDLANGDNRSGEVSAYYLYSDEANGLAWYYIYEVVAHKQPASPGSTVGVQPLGDSLLAIRWDFDGVIELYKRSAASEITDGNSCYSLEGAQYGIYPSYMDAYNKANVIEILTTDATGYAVSGRLIQRTYFIRELIASPGYSVDENIYTVVLNSTLYILEVEEVPDGDPVRTIVMKFDVSTGGAWGMDDAAGKSLAGAQFTIKYYDGYYDTVEEAELSGSPTRTWVIETKAGGRAALDNEWLITGSDPLYMGLDGNPLIPLGTVLIQETKAPDAYLLPNPNTIYLQQIRFDTVLQQVIEFNEIIIPERPRELEFLKVDKDTKAPLGGAKFDIYKYDAELDDWVKLYEKTTAADGTFGISPIAIGSYKMVETEAPLGYLLPTESGNPETFFTIEEDDAIKTVVAENYEDKTIIPKKIDKDTHEPIPNTEFTLYRYPVELRDGEIITDLAGITAKSPGWTEVARAITDDDGVALFEHLPFGYYLLVESRPNPKYVSYQENGGGDRFVVLDKYATGEAQIFENEVIQISCEVYKKTIALTSSALDGTSEDTLNNVGSEEYLYRFGARSNSNTWVDEFIIVDDLRHVTSLGYRMTTLWTGTAPAGMDFDNKMAVLYKTDRTEDNEQPIFTYNPLSANPDNPNNPNRNMVYSNEPGWRIWAEELSTTTQTRLDVADLDLAEDEYIIALKIVYGGVERGFYTGSGWKTMEEIHTIGHVEALSTAAMSSRSEPLEDWWYAVVATQGLRTYDEVGNETVMKGSVQAEIARNNGVLKDNDTDTVETRVIEPFSFPTISIGIVGIPMPNNYPDPPSGSGIPKTGDQWALPAAGVGTLVLGVVLTVAGRQGRRNRQQCTD